MASWTLKELDNWTDLSFIPNVIKLDIAINKLTKIPLKVFKLTSLQILNCYYNKITKIPKEIRQLINLKEFNCHSNKLKKLPKEIGQLINLETFHFSYNEITRLPEEIGQLINLKVIQCYANNIVSLPISIRQLINLKIFNCSTNRLQNLPNEIWQLINLVDFRCANNALNSIPNEIGQLTNLKYLYFNDNQISQIPNTIGHLINIQELYCNSNQLTRLPNEIGQIINLRFFCYSNNPIIYIPPNINRIIGRIKNHQNIYSDQQNVHNHDIQNCIRQSINNIIQIKPSINNLETFILENNNLSDKTISLLFDYILNEDLFNNITFKELLLVVLTIIETKPNKNDIYEILNQEINDAECKCLTGRISRLINILNGQDDRIIINISDKEQIGNIIVLIKNNLGNEYTIEKHKELVIKELKERGFNEDIINEYVSFIE